MTVKGHKYQWPVRDKIGACFGTRRKIYQAQTKVFKSEADVFSDKLSSTGRVQCRVTNFLSKKRLLIGVALFVSK